MNLLSWTRVLLNWPEETNDKSLKDKFKTKEPEFNQFPGVLKRTWNSRSVSVNEFSLGSPVSQDEKFQFTFRYWSKGSLLVVGYWKWASFTCMSSNSILYQASSKKWKINKFWFSMFFSLHEYFLEIFLNDKLLSICVLLLLFLRSLKDIPLNFYMFLTSSCSEYPAH